MFLVGLAKCGACGHRWRHVQEATPPPAALHAVDLECERCRGLTGSFTYTCGVLENEAEACRRALKLEVPDKYPAPIRLMIAVWEALFGRR